MFRHLGHLPGPGLASAQNSQYSLCSRVRFLQNALGCLFSHQTNSPFDVVGPAQSRQNFDLLFTALFVAKIVSLSRVYRQNRQHKPYNATPYHLADGSQRACRTNTFLQKYSSVAPTVRYSHQLLLNLFPSPCLPGQPQLEQRPFFSGRVCLRYQFRQS